MGYFLHFLKLLSVCMVFSLVARAGTWTVNLSNWSVFIWCFCFTVTLLILIVDLFGLQYHLCLSWDNFLVTWACHVTHHCLSAFINTPLSTFSLALRHLLEPYQLCLCTLLHLWLMPPTWPGPMMLVSSLALCSPSQDCSRGWSKMLDLAESGRGRRLGMTSQPPGTLKGFWCQGMYEHKHTQPHTDPHTEHTLRHTPLDRVMQVLVGAF